MRKPKTTTKTIIHFTLKRRPEGNRNGDERGRVWFHKYSFLDKPFYRAPLRYVVFLLTSINKISLGINHDGYHLREVNVCRQC